MTDLPTPKLNTAWRRRKEGPPGADGVIYERKRMRVVITGAGILPVMLSVSMNRNGRPAPPPPTVIAKVKKDFGIQDWVKGLTTSSAQYFSTAHR